MEGKYITNCEDFREALSFMKEDFVKLGKDIPNLQWPVDKDKRKQIQVTRSTIINRRRVIKNSMDKIMFGYTYKEFNHIDGRPIAVVRARQIEVGASRFKIKVGDKIRVLNQEFLLKNTGLVLSPDYLLEVVGFSNRGSRVVMRATKDEVIDYGSELFTGDFGIEQVFEVVKS